MNVSQNVNLQPYHTFGIDVECDYLVEVTTIEDMIEVMTSASWQHLTKLILGKGSNVLFTEKYRGMVVVNRLQGKQVTESEGYVHLHVAGGEDWPSLVEWSLQQGYNGLENLALIPGCAGSAPIQNIGAYGVELKDVCEYVEYLDLADFSLQRLNAQQCQFGYRDSIFKQQLLGQVVITAIGLKLPKQWQPQLSYGPLKAIESQLTSPLKVFEQVCQIRRSKLPDPNEIGNAGSFFKNPVISQDQFSALQQQHPDLSGYPVDGGVKIAAGWLIDRCGLKGYRIGGAQVHELQALVLVNCQAASAQDVLQLAHHVQQSVADRYGIHLQHEVRFFAASTETTLDTIFSY